MKKCILVVEDDPHIRLGLCDALGTEGFEVAECADGAQVLPLLRQRRPDLVILDLMLPQKSGYDLCREIRVAKNRGRSKSTRAPYADGAGRRSSS